MDHKWVHLQVSVEVKEGHEGEPLPTGRQVAAAVQDYIGDITKHGEQFAYRTLEVLSVGDD